MPGWLGLRLMPTGASCPESHSPQQKVAAVHALTSSARMRSISIATSRARSSASSSSSMCFFSSIWASLCASTQRQHSTQHAGMRPCSFMMQTGGATFGPQLQSPKACYGCTEIAWRLSMCLSGGEAGLTQLLINLANAVLNTPPGPPDGRCVPN